MSDFLQKNNDVEGLWAKQAENLPWFKKWSKVLEWKEPFAHWFVDGQINASYACLDVHLQKPELKNKVAILWEDENGKEKKITYAELHKQVNNFASLLQRNNVTKGDIVVIYLPMIPQAIVSMLAVTRLGATHSVVFSGFSAAALKSRIDDMQAKFLITCDVAYYRNKENQVKKSVDEVIASSSSLERVFILQRSVVDIFANNDPVEMVRQAHHERDHFTARPEPVEGVSSGLQRDPIEKNVSGQACYEVFTAENLEQDSNSVIPVPVESNHPLFILYTSGTTGKPKGIIHSTGGYLTYVYSTIKWAFDISHRSVYWCTADVGWITGHSYVVYGPLMHGATIYMREGAPDWPNPSVWWRAIEKHKISIFYTSPTALRMFMKFGNSIFQNIDLSSLKVLGSVGEPINPEVWLWYNDQIGRKMCPIIDTWWQTETGGFMIAPAAGLELVKLKPGSATFPLPGICAEIVDYNNDMVSPQTKGYLVIKKPWPGMSIGIYNNPELFKQIYWSRFKNAYYSGDYAIKDKEGYFWLLGRADEVLNVSGHRIGTSEVESATLEHAAVAETAAISIKDDVKGEAIVVFTSLKNGFFASSELKQEIVLIIRKQIGAFATPKDIYFVDKLPKTRSGKIMRRILKAIVQGEQIGDVSTLEDGASIEEIKIIYQNFKQSFLR